MKKNVLGMHKAHSPHMVGDGLPVRNFFSYGDLGRSELSPFLMLDYGAPVQFPPTKQELGVGMHPHRGFETVTLAYQGGLQHRDTAGNHGEIGPGDVQWMTAGSGVLHEELHSKSFRENGGTLQMAQLWVNLPAELKLTAPKYQTLLRDDIPVINLDAGKATLRVVAGNFGQAKGPAETFTPVNLYDVKLKANGTVELDLPAGYTTALVVLDGSANVNGADAVEGPILVVLDRKGTSVQIGTESGAHILVLNGEPIDEPVVGYGPFVMNSREQILEAVADFQNGKFGKVLA